MYSLDVTTIWAIGYNAVVAAILSPFVYIVGDSDSLAYGDSICGGI